MNASKFLAVATLSTLAAVASVAAHADSADAPEFAKAFAGNRLRAEVQAEAVQRASNPNFEPLGSRVAPQIASKVDRAAVRAEAAIAQRAGQIGHGEAGI